jgi:hypothetical protein
LKQEICGHADSPMLLTAIGCQQTRHTKFAISAAGAASAIPLSVGSHWKLRVGSLS